MENSIEENIKEIECFFKRNYFVNYDWTIIHRNSMANLEDSIEDILSDYKRVLKENEELKADNYELNNRITDLLENIPVQKIKDKIEELKKKVEELTDEQGYWGGSDLLEQIKVLEEILEKEQ